MKIKLKTHIENETKANVSHLDLVTDLEALIFEHELFEPLGQLDMVTYIMLQPGNPIGSQHEPEIIQVILQANSEWNWASNILLGGHN